MAVSIEAIIKAFEKLVPAISKELVAEVWMKESYPNKDEFLNEAYS
jgi:hypothetical protein